ncbi:MAG: polysaccharide deacetylase [Clostridia bacterium]|nr:polysaccharide deacetylase [Clostridia bacterium]
MNSGNNKYNIKVLFKGENFIEMVNYYGYDEVSLTVVKRLNKKKVFGLLLIILFILLMILLYVFNIHKKMLKMKEENQYANIENSNVINNEETPNQNAIFEEGINIANKGKLPQLTQVGRENLNNIYSTNEKIAYITFDDGPSQNITPQILNILDQYKIKATFFLLGRNVARYPSLVKQEYETGHYIANHGYSHEYNTIYASAQAVLDEYSKTEQLIRTVIGQETYCSHLFRFPGGSGGKKYRNVKTEAKQLLSDNNILYIDWNSLTNDSVGKPTQESIMNNLISTVGTKNSVVILMHDAATKQLTADMLPQVLNYLIEKGYEFKTFYDVIM